MTIHGSKEKLDWLEEIEFNFDKIIPTSKVGNVNKWRIDNWGTKWHASEVKFKRVRDDLLLAYFCTPWYPPDKILMQLTNDRDLRIKGKSDIEGNDIVTWR